MRRNRHDKPTRNKKSYRVKPMVFWLAVLAGGLFAWLAVRIGFFETWTALFNIVIAIYLSIFLTPVITDVIPAAFDTLYGNALAMIAIAAAVFLILHGISYTFLTGQFSVPFPRIFDIVFAGLLGFIAGFLVLSFAILVFMATPVSQHSLVQKVGIDRQSLQTNLSYINWWCDLVHRFAGPSDSTVTSDAVINELLDSSESNIKPKIDRADSNKPRENNEPKTNACPSDQPTQPADANAKDQ